MKLEEPHVQDALQSLDEDKQFQLLDLKTALPYDDFSDLSAFHNIVDFLRKNEIDVDFSNLPEVFYESKLSNVADDRRLMLARHAFITL